MENKQEVILNLLREMLRLMFKLTFVSQITDMNEIKTHIRYVRYKLDEFEKVFIKEDENGNKKDI